MKRAVRIIAGTQVAAGFRAAGLPTVEVDDAVAAAAHVGAVLNDLSIGVVMVEERLYDALSDDVRARIARQPLPLIIPFPGPVWEPRDAAAESYVVELLRRAIGYRVRLT